MTTANKSTGQPITRTLAAITGLKNARLQANLTQQALAKRLGIQQSRVSEVETGKHSPRLALYFHWLEICNKPARKTEKGTP